MDALANTITPLIGATDFYLFVLNAGIGWFEAWVLRRWFRGRPWAVLWMIPANYFSAWAGWFALHEWLASAVPRWLGDRPIEHVTSVAAAVWGFAFAVTLATEWPFVIWAIQGGHRSAVRVMAATVAVNVASYLLVGVWFLQSFSLPLDVRVTSLSRLPPPPTGTLYWVDPSGRVMARRMGLGVTTTDRAVGRVVKDDFVWPNMLDVVPGSPGRVRLEARYSRTIWRDRPTPPGDVEPEDPTVVSDAGSALALPSDFAGQSRLLRKSVLDLRPPDHRTLAVTFDWYRHFITAAVPGGPSVYLTVGFGPVDWTPQDPTVLTNDAIVFEWAGQIVLLAPAERSVAFVVAGTCPAFVPD